MKLEIPRAYSAEAVIRGGRSQPVAPSKKDRLGAALFVSGAAPKRLAKLGNSNEQANADGNRLLTLPAQSVAIGGLHEPTEFPVRRRQDHEIERKLYSGFCARACVCRYSTT